MGRIDELLQQLRALDVQEEVLTRRRARVTRSLVDEAGGVKAAAALLGQDPRTVSRRTRLDDVAMVVYRNTAGRADGDGGHNGDVEQEDRRVHREADARWWRVDQQQRAKIKLLVVVSRGEVRRIWRVLSDRPWHPKDDGSAYVEVPVEDTPLTADEVRMHYPDLGLNLGDPRPMRQGLIREYLPLDSPNDREG